MGDLTNCSTRKRIIVLLRYLYLNTDERHPASTYDLLDYLEAQGVGTNRKTLKTDMEFLTGEDSVYDIVEIKSKPNRYFWGSREFELPELKLLVDAVQSSRVISKASSDKLIHKLEGLASQYEGSQLQRQVYVDGRPKSTNRTLPYAVDALFSAINAGKMVQFHYKKRGYPELRTISPWQMAWENGCYYLIAYQDEKPPFGIRNYRYRWER